MKTIFVLMLLASVGASATSNPYYPLTAHVIGSESGRGHGGSLTARTCTYEFRIGDLTYITVQRTLHCDTSVIAGSDLPARVEKNKLKLLKNDSKELSLEIVGTHE